MLPTISGAILGGHLGLLVVFVSHRNSSKQGFTFTDIGTEMVTATGICCVQVNYVLKIIINTFTHTQNAPAELRRCQIKLARKSRP